MRCVIAMLVLALVAMVQPSAVAAEEAVDQPREGRVRVATLVYGDGKSEICFSAGFLETVARETGIPVQRGFDRVELASDELFNYPLVVMTGEGAFTLDDAERERLRAYVEHGGFILASAGCSNAPWIGSFQAMIGEVFGDDALRPMEMDHPVFHMLFEIEQIQMKKATQVPALHGLSQGGRLRIVFSPMGLNDTGNASEGCCCCGGNEIRNARSINANILTYALTH